MHRKINALHGWPTGFMHCNHFPGYTGDFCLHLGMLAEQPAFN
jgi:hypothetical protein